MASTVNDAPEVFDLWKPKNYEGKFEGPVLLRHALARSINTVSIRLTSDITPDAIVAFAHKMGIASELPKEMSIALGSGVVTPLEMTNAICTLAAGGVFMPPRFVETVNGKPVDAPPGEQVLRPEVAYVVTDMMRSVVTEGTGHVVADLKIPVAGKTGTSNDERDAWQARLQGTTAWVYDRRIPKAGYVLQTIRGPMLQHVSYAALALFVVAALWRVWAPRRAEVET